eukprot:m.217592 g.217592  ORF g.217592 m.217592 type:complete len:109 (+) comp15888_c0_seq5:1076-1402(+)
MKHLSLYLTNTCLIFEEFLDTICIIGGTTDFELQHAKEIHKLSGQSWVKLLDELSKLAVNPAAAIGNVESFRTSTTTRTNITTMDLSKAGNLFVWKSSSFFLRTKLSS